MATEANEFIQGWAQAKKAGQDTTWVLCGMEAGYLEGNPRRLSPGSFRFVCYGVGGADEPEPVVSELESFAHYSLRSGSGERKTAGRVGNDSDTSRPQGAGILGDAKETIRNRPYSQESIHFVCLRPFGFKSPIPPTPILTNERTRVTLL